MVNLSRRQATFDVQLQYLQVYSLHDQVVVADQATLEGVAPQGG